MNEEEKNYTEKLKKYNKASITIDSIILGIFLFIILINLLTGILYGAKISSITAAILTLCWGFTGYNYGIRRGKEKILTELWEKLVEDDTK